MWAIGCVPHNSEMKVLNKIREMNIAAFVPLGTRITKPQRKRKPVLTTFKMFPGYIFVDIPIDIDWLEIAKLKVRFLTFKDNDGNIQITPLPDHIVSSIKERDETESSLVDLFVDYGKKSLRASFQKNQLVCWKDKGNYLLGFVSRNTQGKEFAYVSTEGEEELKISVDLLSLL